jgi:hypothetical protein
MAPGKGQARKICPLFCWHHAVCEETARGTKGGKAAHTCSARRLAGQPASCLAGLASAASGAHLCRLLLQLGRGQLVHIPKDGDPRVGQPRPPRHLHHHAAARVLQQVARLDGQRGQAEDGVPRTVGRKVDQRAKGVARPPVVHVGHDGAEVRKLSLLHQVAHCRGGGGGRSPCVHHRSWRAGARRKNGRSRHKKTAVQLQSRFCGCATLLAARGMPGG